MSAAVFIVENLVIGIQAGVGLLLWLIGMMGFGVLHKPLFLLDMHGGSWKWLPALGMIALAASYAAGIFVDRIAVPLFQKLIRPVSHRIFSKRFRQSVHERARRTAEESETFVWILLKEGQISAFIQDYRSRLKVVRSTFVNTIVIWFAFWMTPHLRNLLPGVAQRGLFLHTMFLIFLGIWVAVWVLLQVAYEERLAQVERISRS